MTTPRKNKKQLRAANFAPIVLARQPMHAPTLALPNLIMRDWIAAITRARHAYHDIESHLP